MRCDADDVEGSLMSKTDIVSVTGLSKKFGKIKALKEFTLDIEPGIFGLIGPNGAGI